MNSIKLSMTSGNSKTSAPHRLLLNLSNKINLKRSYEYVALSSLSIVTWKNIKKTYKNNKFVILRPRWNNKFELLERSYSVLDIQDYMEKGLVILQ